MKEIVIISGKGGTGKTSVCCSLAVFFPNKILADCDVDAPDLHLVLSPKIKQTKDFTGSVVIKRIEDKCTECGLCRELCRFNAIDETLAIDDFLCEGCGLCFHACPVNAITMDVVKSGEEYITDTPYGIFVYAQLSPGEENSGRLAAEVKQLAREQAIQQKADYILVDGPPGVGCPVIASLSGADIAVIVTEPTLSGISDLKRVAELASSFKVKTQVIINKWDINQDNSKLIEKFCGDNGITFLGKLPFTQQVSEAVKKGIPVVEYDPKAEISQEIEKIYHKLIFSQ